MKHLHLQILPLILGAVFLGGCSVSTTPNAKAPISPVSYREMGLAARTLERQGDGRTSGPAEGRSMQPLYGDNAYLVISPIDYPDLEPGMLVAYYNLSGRRVVHLLGQREGTYWTVRGINNAHEDADYVTPQNLIGVVYSSFVAMR